MQKLNLVVSKKVKLNQKVIVRPWVVLKQRPLPVLFPAGN